jgi:predicted nucleotidyltransferase
MAKLMPGVRREDLVPAEDPGEGRRVAEEAARQLKVAYGERVRQVVLFGSWVRGEAHEESDVDLIVVLDQIENRARERDRLVEVLYDLEVEPRRAIEAFPVVEADAQSGARPFVVAALRDGTSLLRAPVVEKVDLDRGRRLG